MTRPTKVLSATGFGGTPRAALLAGVERGPDAIAVDMGSVDPGPFYLGSGAVGGATDEDLELLLEAREAAGVPLLCGSAGTAGGRVQLIDVRDRLLAICRDKGWSPTVATLDAEVEPGVVHDALDAGRSRPLGPVPELTHEEIERATRIVGQVGPEPFMAALNEGADVVLGGRACDTSPFVAVPLLAGHDPGLAFHMAKVSECNSLCAVPGGRDSLLATVYDDHVELESMHPDRRCTPQSVAAHSLYEQPDPYLMAEPGGVLDTQHSIYTALDERRASIAGSRWLPASQYTIKLEGARRVGHRFFCIAGVRDPGAIEHLPDIEASVLEGVTAGYGPPGGRYRVMFRVYGRDGVMGAQEPVHDSVGHEVCVLIDVVADDARLARAICNQLKQSAMHCGFEGRRCTAGNLALPFSPEVHDGGEVYEFSIYHLVEVDDPLAFSTITYLTP